MTITLTFGPDEQDEAKVYLAAMDLFAALHEHAEALRTALKYGEGPQTVEQVRESFHKLLEEHDVSSLLGW